MTKNEIKYELCNAHGYASGAQACLYLIPSKESASGNIEIYMDVQIGNGCPMSAWNNRWYTLGSVGTECEPESLQNELEQFEDEYREIDDAYLGSEWNGNNHIGQWDQAAIYNSNWDNIAMQARENCNQFWSATDWFQGSLADIDLTKESIAAIAEWESCTADGAVLDQDDCETFLRHAISERVEEITDSLEDLDSEDGQDEIIELTAELENLQRLQAT